MKAFEQVYFVSDTLLTYLHNAKAKLFIFRNSLAFIIVFRLVRDVVANHKTTRYAGAATKVIQKITLLKYNVGVQAALYTKER